MRLEQIYRYPIKGLSAQPLGAIALREGLPMPMDRVFAFTRPGTPIDPEAPRWAKKGMFIMLMLEEGLARAKTSLDVDTLHFTASQANGSFLSADLNGEAGRDAAEDLIQDLAPTLKGRPRLVRSTTGHFMDKPDSVLSLINLATVRSLEAYWGIAIDPLRFRANLYIDGLEPWHEFDWIGQTVRIGEVSFCVDRRNGRCGATNVDPATGARNLHIPGSLRRSFGHKDLGVYLKVTTGGRIAAGQAVTLAASNAVANAAVANNGAPVRSAAGSHICGGCYYIYVDGQDDGHVPFAALPADWRCPDCGADRSVFRSCHLG